MPDEHSDTGRSAPGDEISVARLYLASRENPDVAKDGRPREHEVVRGISDRGFDYPTAARENREFLLRAVDWAARHGVAKFLDVGAGMPEEAGTNVHEIAQAVNEDAEVLYVDKEFINTVYQTAKNRSGGRTHFLQADLRDPDRILTEARDFLGFDEPICLILNAVVHFIPDADDPHAIVTRLSGAMPPGSSLILSHVTDEYNPPQARAIEADLLTKGLTAVLRPLDQIRRLFDGYKLVPPGLTGVHQWHPVDPEAAAMPIERVSVMGGVGELDA